MEPTVEKKADYFMFSLAATKIGLLSLLLFSRQTIFSNNQWIVWSMKS